MCIRDSSGGMNGAIWPSNSTVSNAWIDFCRFICGNQVSDHCSQQPTLPTSRNAVRVNSAWPMRRAPKRRASGFDNADLRRVVLAHEAVDLGDVAVPAVDHQAEVLGREARAVGLVPLERRQPPDRQQTEQGHETAEEDGELEGDDRVG